MAGLGHLPSVQMLERMDAVVEEAQQLAVQASRFLHGMVQSIFSAFCRGGEQSPFGRRHHFGGRRPVWLQQR